MTIKAAVVIAINFINNYNQHSSLSANYTRRRHYWKPEEANISEYREEQSEENFVTIPSGLSDLPMFFVYNFFLFFSLYIFPFKCSSRQISVSHDLLHLALAGLAPSLIL
jgi:hypothetical protein